MVLFSLHLKILQTYKPTTKIQEAKLVERPSDLRRGLQRREVGVVQAFTHPFISVINLSGHHCLYKIISYEYVFYKKNPYMYINNITQFFTINRYSLLKPPSVN